MFSEYLHVSGVHAEKLILCQKALSYAVQISVGGHERWRSEGILLGEGGTHRSHPGSDFCGEKRAFQIRRAVYEWAGLESGVTTQEALQNFNPGA